MSAHKRSLETPLLTTISLASNPVLVLRAICQPLVPNNSLKLRLRLLIACSIGGTQPLLP